MTPTALLLAVFKPGTPRRGQGSGAAEHHGINFPRIYDLLVYVLTRGREDAYRATVLDLAGVGSGDAVLDIGCGTGTQALASWRRVQPGGAVTGVDVSDRMFLLAQRKAARAGAAIDFRKSDAAGVPFADESFDVVTVTTVLHMIPEDRRRLAIGEATRVLRKGGRLLIVDYAGEPRKRRHLSARHGAHGKFDLDALRPMLSEAGLTSVEGGSLGWLSLHFVRATKP